LASSEGFLARNEERRRQKKGKRQTGKRYEDGQEENEGRKETDINNGGKRVLRSQERKVKK
jgi:hypothetical protein